MYFHFLLSKELEWLPFDADAAVKTLNIHEAYLYVVYEWSHTNYFIDLIATVTVWATLCTDGAFI